MIKQSIVLIPALVFGAVPSGSLAHANPAPGITINGGLDAANLGTENRVNRYGFTGGFAFYLQWPFADRFSIATQLDLLYVPRGANVVDAGMQLGEFRQHYLDVAITARPGMRFGSMSTYLLLGGGPSILYSASKKEGSTPAQDITGLLRRVDVVLRVGAGVAVHLPPRRLGPFHLDTVFLEARYDRGLIDADAVSGGFDNRTTSLMLGLSFALASKTSVGPSVTPASASDLSAPAVNNPME